MCKTLVLTPGGCGPPAGSTKYVRRFAPDINIHFDCAHHVKKGQSPVRLTSRIRVTTGNSTVATVKAKKKIQNVHNSRCAGGSRSPNWRKQHQGNGHAKNFIRKMGQASCFWRIAKESRHSYKDLSWYEE